MNSNLNSNSSVVIFDLDRTLIRGNSSFSFSLFLTKEGVFSRLAPLSFFLYKLKHELGFLSLTELHHAVCRKFLQGLPKDLLSEKVDKYLKIAQKTLFYPPAVQRLREEQAKGSTTICLSSSPEFLVAPIAKLLKMDAWQGTTYVFDKQEHLSHIDHLVTGSSKASYVEDLGLSIDQLTAYTDSHLDLELLKVVGKPIVVQPTKKLKAIARTKGWEILEESTI